MSVTVRIPTPLRGITNDQDSVTADAADINALIADLEASYPGMAVRLVDEAGELRRFVNVFVNGEDVRFMDGLETGLKAGDEVSIVPAVAGGSDSIRIEQDGPIVTVTLDRPEKMNSLNPEMFSTLARFWQEFEADDSQHVAIVTGTGRAFSSGRDLLRTNAAQDERERYNGADPDAPFAIDQISKPVIGAINGWCLAAGFALALACDLRIMAEGARIGSVAPRRGLTSAAGQAQRLVRYVPFGLALELLLRGNHVDAHEAHRIGLVNAVVPPDQLLPTARAWAEEIASNAPLSVRYNKRAAYEGGLASDGAFQKGLEIEAELYRQILRTKDMQEGVRAFLERRPPIYKGR